MQRPEIVAAQHSRFGFLGLLTGAVLVEPSEGVQYRVVLGDAPEEVLGHLHR